MLTDERRDEFKKSVESAKLKTEQSNSDGWIRIVGIVLMVIGVVGAFVVYNMSLAQNDPRDIYSGQILAIALTALTLAGAAMFVASTVSRVLRLWLLRQLIESQDRADELAEALRSR